MKEITNIIYFTFAVVALACFVLLPKAQAVSPPPDGGYPNQNTAEGDSALFSLTSGINNTAIGFQALNSNTIGGFNTATGSEALLNNTTGSANVANGFRALVNNTTGSLNTANGSVALLNNTTGSYNTANGYEALASNTTGFQNTADGVFALDANTTGRSNVANGFGALAINTTGSQNTANGAGDFTPRLTGALANNTTGNRNTATGNQALLRNQTGNGNTAEGFQALANNTGSFNIAVGFTAGVNLTTGTNNIDIGALGVAGDSNTMRIGTVNQTATYITGISGATVPGGVGVIIDSTGHLGTVVSSERLKHEIKPMEGASEAILGLKPVIFRYKHELDPDGILQFGLVAEQVEKVNPDLVARDPDGKPYTVRYEAVNAMLLNEFLKEHRTVQELKTTVAKQQKQIERLTEGLQKVSAQVEASKPTPQVVANDQ
jgi:hypothetical protein